MSGSKELPTVIPSKPHNDHKDCRHSPLHPNHTNRSYPSQDPIRSHPTPGALALPFHTLQSTGNTAWPPQALNIKLSPSNIFLNFLFPE